MKFTLLTAALAPLALAAPSMSPAPESSLLQPRWFPVCSKDKQASVADIKTCIEKLKSRDRARCSLSEMGASMCGANSRIGGFPWSDIRIAVEGRGTDYDLCANVAAAAQWVIDNCKLGGKAGVTGGATTATGNSNLIVWVEGENN